MLHQIPVPFLHAAAKIGLCGVDYSIRLGEEKLVDLDLLRAPTSRLTFTGDNDREAQLWEVFSEGEQGKCRQGIEPQGAAGKEIGVPYLGQGRNGLFQPSGEDRGHGRVDETVPRKTAT